MSQGFSGSDLSLGLDRIEELSDSSDRYFPVVKGGRARTRRSRRRRRVRRSSRRRRTTRGGE